MITLSADQITDQFPRDVTGHQMHVLHDQGVYRHLRFHDPRHGMNWFELITLPSTLVIQGDGDTLAFRFPEDTDPFEFFLDTALPGPRPNVTFWRPQLTSAAQHEHQLVWACHAILWGIARYDQRQDALDEHHELPLYVDCGHEHTDTDPAALDLGDGALVCEDGYTESICTACCVRDGRQTDECREHHAGQCWPCHAIPDGVTQYRQQNTETTTEVS